MMKQKMVIKQDKKREDDDDNDEDGDGGTDTATGTTNIYLLKPNHNTAICVFISISL